jgi:hypothetical protein
MRTEVMPVQEFAVTTNILEYAAQGCFEGERTSRSDFGLDLRPVFHLPQIEPEKKQRDASDEAFGEERGESRFLGGSDPPFERLGSRPTPSVPGVATAQVVQQTSSLRRRQSCKRSSQEFRITSATGE